jgi:hypothetical protein
MEKIENVINKPLNDLHPCQYCLKMCRGKQCKECHLKMVESKQGQCLECEKTFYAIRADGSKRRRCLDCQNNYNAKYISQCPICKSDYHAFLEDGRAFDKCYTCYQNSFTECINCSEKAPNGHPLCKNCYLEEKSKVSILSYNSNPGSVSDIKTLRECQNEGCLNQTVYSYCKSCYNKIEKEVSETDFIGSKFRFY